MKAHIIFLNDSPEAVVLNNLEIAKKKMIDLANEYYEKNKWNFHNSIEEYKTICYWHIHTLEVEV